MDDILSKIKNKRKYLLLLIDILTVSLCYFLALTIYYYSLPFMYVSIIGKSFFICVFTYILFFYFFRIYESIWRYADVEDFFMCLIASISSGIFFTIVDKFTGSLHSISFYITTIIFITFSIISIRMAYRLYRRGSVYKSKLENNNNINKQNVMIIGAGQAGIIMKNEIEREENDRYNVACLVDDDIEKIGRKIDGTIIEGQIKNVEAIAKKYKISLIIVAMPSVKDEKMKKILEYCSNTRCTLKILPSISAVVSHEDVKLIDKIKPVEIEDLLGRKPIKLENDDIKMYLKDKNVIVTGGGGSIGSELCRQIAGYKIKSLTIIDIYENNAYDIQNELLKDYKDSLKLDVIIASVRDEKKLREIFAEKMPDVVFHAAAHKHVPLMERSPSEAIKNNVFGTYNVAKVSDEMGVKKFVLISTDKAVNPTNIMGATKRMAEMIIQSMSKTSKTEFVAVRFGNVLGSNGSVIPLFKKQIENGGPITVTDERITRFFMTIPEAVQLVLKAGSIAIGGEIFILDMGESVKIKDLAENLIKLSGFKPYEDIDIVYTGLRPGEKLYEELLIDEEGLKETVYEKIFIGKPIDIDISKVDEKLKLLKEVLYEKDNFEIKKTMSTIVDTYTMQE